MNSLLGFVVSSLVLLTRVLAIEVTNNDEYEKWSSTLPSETFENVVQPRSDDTHIIINAHAANETIVSSFQLHVNGNPAEWWASQVEARYPDGIYTTAEESTSSSTLTTITPIRHTPAQ